MEDFSSVESFPSDPQTYARIDQTGRLINVEESTNTLSVFDKEGELIKTYNGNTEKIYSKKF